MEKKKIKKEEPWWVQVKKRLDRLEIEVSYIKGTLDEMKRHNSKTIKTLSAIITGLLGIIGTLLGIIAWLIK